MKLAVSTQLGWGDAADYFDERDRKDGWAVLKVPAVVEPQMEEDGAASALLTFGQRPETLDILSEISQMPQGTSQPGCSHRRLHTRKPQSHKFIASLPHVTAPNLTLIQKLKHILPISLYPGI